MHGARSLSVGSGEPPDREKDRWDEDAEVSTLSVAWQEKHFSPSEIKFYTASKQEDFADDILKLKFFRDVQVGRREGLKDVHQRSRCVSRFTFPALIQALMKQKKGTADYKQGPIFTCVDKEVLDDDEVPV